MCYLHLAVQKFNDTTSTPSSSGRHRRACDKRDIVKIVTILLSAKVFRNLKRDVCVCVCVCVCSFVQNILAMKAFIT